MNYKYYNALTIAFVICLMTSNLAATKLCQFGSLTLPGGIIIFPLLYPLNDILTEVYGFTASRKVILTALICNLFMTVVLSTVVYLPPADHWSNDEAYSGVFSLSPLIFIASFSSYFVGELTNATVISLLKIRLEGKYFIFRAIFSTLAGALIETVIFVTIAFSSMLPFEYLVRTIVTLTTIKVLYELAIIPFTVRIVSFLKNAESTDSFERPSFKAVLQIG
jgi:hypothetical protein